MIHMRPLSQQRALQAGRVLSPPGGWRARAPEELVPAAAPQVARPRGQQQAVEQQRDLLGQARRQQAQRQLLRLEADDELQVQHGAQGEAEQQLLAAVAGVQVVAVALLLEAGQQEVVD